MDSISNLFQLATTHWVFTFLCGFATLISIPLSVFLFIKGTSSKKPTYSFLSATHIIGLSDLHSKLELRYKGHGEPIENFTVTKFLFYNAGRSSIRRDDIPQKHPMTIHINDQSRILESTLIYQSRPTNEVKEHLSQDRKRITLGLDYLNESDGFVLQIFHTGDKSSLTFECEIIDGKCPRASTISTFFDLRLLVMTWSLLVVTLSTWMYVSSVQRVADTSRISLGNELLSDLDKILDANVDIATESTEFAIQQVRIQQRQIDIQKQIDIQRQIDVQAEKRNRIFFILLCSVLIVTEIYVSIKYAKFRRYKILLKKFMV